jgi:hypothetical protein
MNTKPRLVLAAILFCGASCATSSDEPTQSAESALDSSGFELASEAQIETEGLDVLVQAALDQQSLDAQILFGCSNAQIRSAQAACRSTFCGTRGSNGIHFCDQRPPNVVAQCDCKTGADPVITCSLTACPQ